MHLLVWFAIKLLSNGKAERGRIVILPRYDISLGRREDNSGQGGSARFAEPGTRLHAP